MHIAEYIAGLKQDGRSSKWMSQIWMSDICTLPIDSEYCIIAGSIGICAYN